MRRTDRVRMWTSGLLLLLLSGFGHTRADNQPKKISKSSTAAAESVYKKIDFCGGNVLPYGVFEKAYCGYMNLLHSGKLSLNKELLTIADYSLSSVQKRLWVIDLASAKVLFNTFVAHGQGTGDEFAEHFSNQENSHQSSMGFFVTGNTYNGGHGLSLYLNGMDEGFNTAAMARSVVIHGAAYVSEQFIAANKRLGRSWGCPALNTELAPKIIDAVKNGTCLFIYFPDKKFLTSSRWLRKGNDTSDDDAFGLRIPADSLPSASAL